MNIHIKRLLTGILLLTIAIAVCCGVVVLFTHFNWVKLLASIVFFIVLAYGIGTAVLVD